MLPFSPTTYFHHSSSPLLSPNFISAYFDASLWYVIVFSSDILFWAYALLDFDDWLKYASISPFSIILSMVLYWRWKGCLSIILAMIFHFAGLLSRSFFMINVNALVSYLVPSFHRLWSFISRFHYVRWVFFFFFTLFFFSFSRRTIFHCTLFSQCSHFDWRRHVLVSFFSLTISLRQVFQFSWWIIDA